MATGPVVAMDSEGEVLACTALVIGACMMATEVREAESGFRTKWVQLNQTFYMVVTPHRHD